MGSNFYFLDPFTVHEKRKISFLFFHEQRKVKKIEPFFFVRLDQTFCADFNGLISFQKGDQHQKLLEFLLGLSNVNY